MTLPPSFAASPCRDCALAHDRRSTVGRNGNFAPDARLLSIDSLELLGPGGCVKVVGVAGRRKPRANTSFDRAVARERPAPVTGDFSVSVGVRRPTDDTTDDPTMMKKSAGRVTPAGALGFLVLLATRTASSPGSSPPSSRRGDGRPGPRRHRLRRNRWPRWRRRGRPR